MTVIKETPKPCAKVIITDANVLALLRSAKGTSANVSPLYAVRANERPTPEINASNAIITGHVVVVINARQNELTITIKKALKSAPQYLNTFIITVVKGLIPTFPKKIKITNPDALTGDH
ncbi:hypothetical protein [Lactiplantibacillus plantarum]|uniref:hypothetical protein n=1 Tax=Lactiplantibacillus plantarum TaxID=1590 RepID=UPI002010DED7|nr:hypothetical protein [Lactiplantibacillus plantarum]